MEENKHFLCPVCGGPMCWDSSAMASERIDDYEGDETAMVNFYHCKRCGRSLEIVDPNEEERKGSYKEYWNENS